MNPASSNRATRLPVGKEDRSMSVSSVSSVSSTDTYQENPFQKVRSDFKQLADALKSGSADDAQQALTTLKSDLPNGGANSPFAKVLDQISSALQSGDVSGAQQALSSLPAPPQGPRGPHGGHRHHRDGDASASGLSAATLNTTTSDGSTIGSTINLSA